MQCGDHKRLAVLIDNSQMRDQSLVEDLIDDGTVVAATLTLAPQPDAIGGGRRRGWVG
jgi:hypothetical protein